MPEEPARDRVWERFVTREIAASLGVDVEPLIFMAGQRADSAEVEYGRDFPDLKRNLELETAEELADARNYVVWRLDEIRRGLVADEDRVPHLQRALRYIALAFEETRAADRG